MPGGACISTTVEVGIVTDILFCYNKNIAAEILSIEVRRSGN